jgi:hypothetical protein
MGVVTVTLRRSHPSERTIKKKQDTIVQGVTLLVYVIEAAIRGLAASQFLLKAAIIPVSAVGLLSTLARRLVAPRLVTDPAPYRDNAVLRGTEHLIVAFDHIIDDR